MKVSDDLDKSCAMDSIVPQPSSYVKALTQVSAFGGGDSKEVIKVK